MTDNAALMKRSDSHARRGTSPAVPKKVKEAVEILIGLTGAPDYAAIAEAVGYRNAAELRVHLTKAQSVRYLRDRKREVLEAINLANPAALRRVRDESANSMAKVQAVRTLESMADRMDEDGGGRADQMSPGVTIVVEQVGRPDHIIGPRPHPVIEARPDEFQDVDNQDAG
jgi:hypothetical protein